jgi:hypothetical protein
MTETDLEKLASMASDENDELVPMDEDDFEDMDQPLDEENKQPDLKPLSKKGLVQLLGKVKDAKIGFKLGEAYFEICSVDLKKCTFTAKPANDIVNDLPNDKNKRKRNRRKK